MSGSIHEEGGNGALRPPFHSWAASQVQVGFGEAICPYLIYLDTWLKYGRNSNHIGRKGATTGIYRWAFVIYLYRCHT